MIHFRRIVLGLALLVALMCQVPQSMAAMSSFIMDAESGRTLQSARAETRRAPASLTKMMTLYLLFEALDRGKVSLNTRFAVSRHAAAQPPTKLGLPPGRTIRVRDAMLALATKSANDIAVVVAEGLAGSETAFARRMTQKARALGMKSTTFRNASGLDATGHVSTARDMARLGRALLNDYPQHSRIFATRAFRYGKATYPNHNRLLGVYRGLDGIKTGYTHKAGFNLVATAKRDGRRVIGVVMGAKTSSERNTLMVRLLDKGFALAKTKVKVASRSKRAAKRGRFAAAPNRPKSAYAARMKAPAGTRTAKKTARVAIAGRAALAPPKGRPAQQSARLGR
ncbi:MAG: D-alanyl-D-alanine carboxypeptidase [Rhodospirillales bacterium]|nr:D-alanyl-D-alanine carboxypeptidase [Rhodospirillales bacterium]